MSATAGGWETGSSSVKQPLRFVSVQVCVARWAWTLTAYAPPVANSVVNVKALSPARVNVSLPLFRSTTVPTHVLDCFCRYRRAGPVISDFGAR